MEDILVITFLKYSELLPINNPVGPDEVRLGSEMAELNFVVQSICTKLCIGFPDFSLLKMILGKYSFFWCL